MFFLYNVLILTYQLLIRLAALFHPKARLWRDGRKGLFNRIAEDLQSGGSNVWFHCSSLGEFEQGRPVIEAFKAAYPDHEIILTFFSPSGYEVRKNYQGADHIFYLPMDTSANATRFIEMIRPKFVFFIKYEYWFNYLNVLHKKKIPVFLISAIFRPGQHFFAWYGFWFRKQLRTIRFFFVQNMDSLSLLNTIGITMACITGDTRFDRVYSIASHTRSFPDILHFKGDKEIFIGGSTWPEDEEVILQLVRSNQVHLKYIIAPHEVDDSRIEKMMDNFGPGAIRYSQFQKEFREADILVIDSIGILSHLYQYGSFAYIGGGFGKGIHNILEAGAFGLPVFFGPNYHKFSEAKEMIRRNGAFCIANGTQLIEQINHFLASPEHYRQCSQLCRDYILEQKGATAKIMETLEGFLEPGN
jgi:3-deoxy-D-manno-octulosonic-acid transferase